MHRNNKKGWKIDLPKFSGKRGEDPNHYLMKMVTFCQGYEINSSEDRIRAFLGSLEGEALDLYLTIELDKQGDKVFKRNFQHALQTRKT